MGLALFLTFLLPHFSAFASSHTFAPIRDVPLTSVELLTNDKELQSIVLTAEDYENARQKLGEFAPLTEKLKNVAEKIAPRIFGGESAACETSILDQLLQFSLAQGLLRDRSNLASVLVALRAQNRIDDVILLPLWKALPAWVEAGVFTPELKSSLAEPKSAEEKRAHDLLGGANRACPTDTLLNLKETLKAESGRKYHRSQLKVEIKNAARGTVLSESTGRWLRALFHAGFDRVPFTLSRVAAKLRDVKNKSSVKSALGTPTLIASKKEPKIHGLSYRIHLYEKYNSDQILLLADMFYRYNQHRDGSTKAALVWTYSDGKQEAYSLDRIEQDDVSVSWLHKEYTEARKSDTFNGKVIDFDDVALATLEVGIMPGKDMDLILKVPEMWDPKVPQWQKVAKAVQTFGGPALVFVPAPFNIISSMAIVLLQGTLLKSNTVKHAVDRGEELF